MIFDPLLTCTRPLERSVTESPPRFTHASRRLPPIGIIASVSEGVSFEVRLANGEKEAADSLWGARHVVARRAAFDADPLHPVNVLPAEIWKLDPTSFGGRSYIETISAVAELTELESGA